jgi:hypothetical protein
MGMQMQGGMANPWAMHFGGGVPGEMQIAMAQRMQLGRDAPGDLPITMCNQPSHGDARLTALAASLPRGGPLPATPAMAALGDAAGGAPLPATFVAPAIPALEDAAEPPAALKDAKPAGRLQLADAPAVASEKPEGESRLSAMAKRIQAARGSMLDERAKALWACIYL